MTYINTVQTVIETKAFIDRAKGLLTDDQRASVISVIAENPEAGALIQGTGGIRKLRIPLQGRGKSGGARVIYYYHHGGIPIFLLFLYAKNERDNLSKAERNEWKALVKLIVQSYGAENE